MANPDAETTHEAVFLARRERRVLARMPKSVRSTDSEALVSAIEDALCTDDDISWSKQLLFASGVSPRDYNSSTSLASIVRNNLLKFDSSLPTWTVATPTNSHVSNMPPTQSLRSLVHRKLSLGDASAAILLSHIWITRM